MDLRHWCSQLFGPTIGVLFVILSLATFFMPPSAVALSNPCALDRANLIVNGSMARSASNDELAAFWNKFVLTSFQPTFEHVDNEQIDPNGSQHIWADFQTYDAGIYQTVTGLNSLVYYRVWLGYGLAAKDPSDGNPRNIRTNWIGRQVGVDPTGGINPSAASVTWGPVFYNGSAALNIPALSIVFRPLNDRATVFLRAINTDSTGRNKVWFDSVCMEPASPQPAPTSAPTRTILPPPEGSARLYLPLLMQRQCNPQVLANLDVGKHPKGLTSDAARNRVFVSLADASATSFVNTTNQTTIGTWWLRSSGRGNGIALIHGRVFAGLRETSSVSILNQVTGAFIASRGAGSLPFGMGASNEKVWIANFGDDTVTVVDAATLAVIGTKWVGKSPSLITPAGDHAFVSLWGSGVADVAGDGSLLHSYSSSGAGSFGVAYDATSNLLYVTNRLTNKLFALNANSGAIVKSVSIEESPYALTVNPNTRRLFVILADSNRLDVRDAVTLNRLATLPLGMQGSDGGDGITLANGRVYVSNNEEGTLTVVQDECMAGDL